MTAINRFCAIAPLFVVFGEASATAQQLSADGERVIRVEV